MRPLGSGSRLKACHRLLEGNLCLLSRFALNLPLSLSLDALTRPCTAPHPTTGRTMGRTGRIEYLGDNALKAGKLILLKGDK